MRNHLAADDNDLRTSGRIRTLGGSWTVDPSTLVSLRLSEAERAVQDGALDRALIEAEELLDENPAHPRGLAIVAHAALGMGDILTALAALNRFVELHPPDARILQSLAAARFEAVDYAGALAAAEQATSLDPSVSAAWHYQGLALERLGKATEAAERFALAHEKDPNAFPISMTWDTVNWEELLKESLTQLPHPLQEFYESVPIRWGVFPAVEDLLENYPPLSPFTDAMYRGEQDPEADPWEVRPKHVTLFKANLARPSVTSGEIQQRITEALIHEALHWLRISEAPK